MSKRIISKQQHLILLLLYIFRFLNRIQIQKFLLNKGDRGINRLLKKLVSQGYAERDFTPKYGTLTKPAVYFLTVLGRKYIRTNYYYHFPKYLRRIGRDNKASKAFRIRCQIIADWYLLLFPPISLRTLKQQIKDNKTLTQQKEEGSNAKTRRKKKKISQQQQTGIAIADTIVRELTTDTEKETDKIPLNTPQFFTPAYFPNLALLPGIKPDAVIRKRTNKGIKLWFLFVLDAYIPRFILRYQFQRIITTLSDEAWEDIYAINILTISPNHQIIVYAKRLLPSLLERYYGNKIQFHFATRNQLYKAQNYNIEIPWATIASTDY